ncbi:CsbD family protein [Methylobacterium sp. NEAU 140]|uniref:CsbD family protein n=1 Tax=Methylobacterium sp. NEAU 140 TaxID=3064945 RepID=UPI0027352333|nr:CsbD family protein [Methylobacterium sp. NEAU 140]MDP4023156.1 CsbD family protein [Methylobacterium sp. NEAU 140]
MNSDHIEGGIRHLRGRVKTATGALRGRPRQQAEGAFDQAAGAAQYAYGRARDTVHDLRRDGEHLVAEGRSRGRAFIDEAEARGHALADEAVERGRHYRGRAEHHGRALARRADENRAATVALVAAVAFGLGWLMRPSGRA